MDFCTLEDKPTYKDLLESAVVRNWLFISTIILSCRVVAVTSQLHGAWMCLSATTSSLPKTSIVQPGQNSGHPGKKCASSFDGNIFRVVRSNNSLKQNLTNLPFDIYVIWAFFLQTLLCSKSIRLFISLWEIQCKYIYMAYLSRNWDLRNHFDCYLAGLVVSR